MNAPAKKSQFLPAIPLKLLKAAWHPMPVPLSGTPKCFDSEAQFRVWIAAATSMSSDGFCRDCTPEYKGGMLKAGRCHFPDTTWGQEVEYGGPRAVTGSAPASSDLQRLPKWLGLRFTESSSQPAAQEAKKSESTRGADELRMDVRGIRMIRDLDDNVSQARPRGGRRKK